MNVRQQVGWAAAIAVLMSGAACSNRPTSMDNGLKEDLAAARTAQSSHLSISPLELGEHAAPGTSARAPQPVNQTAKHAAPQVSQPAPAATVAQAPQTQPAPSVEAPQPVQQAQPVQPSAAATPRPTPVRGGSDDSRHGPYKTEAEIFRQMPWIRP